MDKEPFFKNIKPITIMSLLGTFLSTVYIGLMAFFCTFMKSFPQLSLNECLIFGSLISATDTVAVISTFKKLKVSEHLNSLIFGESLLNDAVAIVLYRSFVLFQTQAVTFNSLFSCLYVFLSSFMGSFSVGIIVGVCSTLIFKYFPLSGSDHEYIERSLLFIIPFISYMLADSIQMSGIVAMLFCGFVMSTYTKYNITSDSYLFFLLSSLLTIVKNYLVSEMLSMLGFISEIFTFLILGISLYSFPILLPIFSPFIVFLIIVIVFSSRFISYFPLFLYINKDESQQITGKEFVL